MLSFNLFDYFALCLHNAKDTDRESKYHFQKLVLSLVKARFDDSTIVKVLRLPPVLHDLRAYVNLISRCLWDTCLNQKGFLANTFI